MAKHSHSLDEKFDLAQSRQLLTGAQAIVRLTLMQKARDRALGLNTAGFVTGYRGSPIAGLEGAFERSHKQIAANDIVFEPALNEDLAATAVWGSQQAELRGEGKYDGVFAIWYGKGPGVDRTGDAFRHANHAGVARHGGALALMGDDHTCESSTCAHQSEFAMVDAMIPVLNPAGVQEMLDYGLHAFALSRYAGVWVGLKCVKDNMESTATVDGSLDRVNVRLPAPHEFAMPLGGLNIRLGDEPLVKERRLHEAKIPAVAAYIRANGLDRTIMNGGPAPKIGIITAGKNYLDTRAALDELGIDEVEASRIGLRLHKLAVVWPLEPRATRAFADGLDIIIVIEEKRGLIENQLKELLYDTRNRALILGKSDDSEPLRRFLFPAWGALDAMQVAMVVAEQLVQRGLGGSGLKARLERLRGLVATRPTSSDLITRTPYFCAGCPHSSSTKIPEGSRAYAGIGCHYMAQWMDRDTEGFTQMGAEGANWIGEAPFSKRNHVFQNMGDGTYTHSGSLAIRAAISAKRTLTFKLLFNDAVAMTGGQSLDGGLTADRVARQMIADGVARCVLVTEAPENYRKSVMPTEISVRPRRDLMEVQAELAAVSGVTVLIYDQTCASEKRRRRKRGLLPKAPERAFINSAVCEGCGDCGVQSNCVAIVPLETEFGLKRKIDQSSCNQDMSCVNGFCPSFVTLRGAEPRKATGPKAATSRDEFWTSIPEPRLPDLNAKPFAMIANGIGGTGVVTVSAVLAQAAHIAGLGFGAIDMTGMAQKGGAVTCHMRVAKSADAIHAIRLGSGNADLILGGDLVVTASSKILQLMDPGKTGVVYSTHESVTGEFTRDGNALVPGRRLRALLEERVGPDALHGFNAHACALQLFGDSLPANFLLVGYAYQVALMPIPAGAIEEAIQLNGAGAKTNIEAFRAGRLAAHDRPAFNQMIGAGADPSEPSTPTLENIVATRARHLIAYQGSGLAEQYRARVARIAKIESTRVSGSSRLASAVAEGYHKVLAYKDEYEVARLLSEPSFGRSIDSAFEGAQGMRFHLAPPLLSALFKDKASGKPRKIAVPAWIALPMFRLLARAKWMRGRPWDLFGYNFERKLERRMIADYEVALDEIEQQVAVSNHEAAIALARQPLSVKGFGHVKFSKLDSFEKERAKLLAEIRGVAWSELPVERVLAHT